MVGKQSLMILRENVDIAVLIKKKKKQLKVPKLFIKLSVNSGGTNNMSSVLNLVNCMKL